MKRVTGRSTNCTLRQVEEDVAPSLGYYSSLPAELTTIVQLKSIGTSGPHFGNYRNSSPESLSNITRYVY